MSNQALVKMVAKRQAAIKAREKIHEILFPISKINLLNAERVRREMRELSVASSEFVVVHYMEKDMALINDVNGTTRTIHRSSNFNEPPNIHCLSSSRFEEVKEICRNLGRRWCSSFSCAHWFSIIRRKM